MADPVVEDPKVVGDETPVEVNAGDKPPESVPWSKYVGIKEKFTRVEGELKTKIVGLEEQVKKTVSTDEHDKVTKELEETKTKLQETSTELETKQEATLSEKRATLVKRGVPEDKAKELSEKELDAVLAVGILKPKPDLSGGAGADTPTSSKAKIGSGFEHLHPTK